MNSGNNAGCRVMVSEGFLKDSIDPAGGKTTVLGPECVGQGLLVITQVGYGYKTAVADSPFKVGLKSRNQLIHEGLMADNEGNILPKDYVDKSYRNKVNRDYPNYIYFRAPFGGKLSGNEQSEHEVAESLYNTKFMNAAQIQELTGKTPGKLFEKLSEIRHIDEVNRKEYHITSNIVIFIRIDPTQTYAYDQNYRTPVFQDREGDNPSQKTLQKRNQIVRERRMELIGSKRLVSDVVNSNYISWEHEMLLRMDTLTPDWFVYQEPYYTVHVRDMRPILQKKSAYVTADVKRKQALARKKEETEAAEKAANEAEAAKQQALRNIPSEEKREKLKKINDEIAIITNKARQSRADGARLVELERQKRELGFEGGGRRRTRRHRSRHRRTHKQKK